MSGSFRPVEDVALHFVRIQQAPKPVVKRWLEKWVKPAIRAQAEKDQAHVDEIEFQDYARYRRATWSHRK